MENNFGRDFARETWSLYAAGVTVIFLRLYVQDMHFSHKLWSQGN